MRQILKPGHPVDFLTPDELVTLVPQGRQVTRMRSPATVALSAAGAGQDEVYKVPAGYEYEARRIVLSLTGNVPSDPVTIANTPLGASSSQVDVDNSASGAAAPLVATLPAAPGATTFITGFEVTGAGATAASVIAVTVVGVLGGTKTYELAIPAGAAVGVTPLIVEFSRPIPASALNTAITVNVPSFGAGNTNAAVTAHGFQQSVITGGRFVAYLRSGSLIEYGQPTYAGIVQVPGVQTWGDQQGPYLRNGEVFEVVAAGLPANGILNVYLEGLLRRPSSESDN